ncbi:MAG: serine/threonine-protein kinase [Myxococcota bacterium]
MERFAGYEVLELLDDAGSSLIHRVRPVGAPAHAPDVVLKRLKPTAEGVSKLLDQFLNEVEITMLLGHPNVVRGIGHGVADGLHFVVLELVDGPDAYRLMTAMQRAGMAPDLGVALHICLSALRGLHHAHNAMTIRGQPLRVVHRDVSPDNFLCARDGQVKLADFGIAKLSTMDVTTDPALGIRGKLAYMSPERVRGEPCGPESDQFSAALAFLELATFRAVYQKRSGMTDVDLRELVARAEVDVPRELPRKLGKCVKKALAPQPRKRFESCAEFADELTDAARDAGLRAGAPELSELIGKLGLGRLSPRPKPARPTF